MEEIALPRAKARPEIESVYVLLRDEAIIYVGRTRNLVQRIGFHLFGTDRHGPKNFNRALRIDLPVQDAAACEGALIRRFNPPLVHGAPVDEGRDVEVLAWFDLSIDPDARDAFVARRKKLFSDAHRSRRVRQWPRRFRRGINLQSVLWKSSLRFLKTKRARSLFGEVVPA